MTRAILRARYVLTVIVLLLLACGPKLPPPLDPASPPHLPSPVGDLYTRHRGQPSDPAVVAVLAGAPWDEVLSGAAGGMALDLAEGRDVDDIALRWHTVRAGYPYAVTVGQVSHVAAGALPPDLAARVQAHADSDIGLARARGQKGDVWVLLVATPRRTIAPLAREYLVGETLVATGLTVVDPLGTVRPLGGTIALDAPGEWLIQASDAFGAIATLPLYVGEPTPEVPPIPSTGGGTTVDEQARSILTHVWGWYGRDAPEFDPMLDSVARARLRDVLAGTETSAERQIRAGGFTEGPVSAASCRAVDAAQCLDRIWWSPERRAVLTGDYTTLGVASAWDAGELVMVVIGAG